jgi:threonine dehydrogenase-like Zn-dependent dehydrogenase
VKAVVFDSGSVRVDEVPEPSIQDPGDAVVAVSASSICGSDLHLLTGKTPGMRDGSVIGHEFVGAVSEAGPESGFEPGQRVVGSFLIACGDCVWCAAGRYNFCPRRRALGLGTLVGDLDGAQAEYVRVPTAKVNLKALDGPLGGLDDEAALFAGDILTTGFYAAHLAGISPGEHVIVIGAGPVGLFCALGARRYSPASVLVLDQSPERVAFARERLGLDAADVSQIEPHEAVGEATGGALADVAFDAVGAAPVFKAATRSVRDGGRVVVVGVYGSERYELPMGVMWARGLDLRFSGQADVQAHWDDALDAVVSRRVDPTRVITHRMKLADAERAYELFASHEAMKVVLRP